VITTAREGGATHTAPSKYHDKIISLVFFHTKYGEPIVIMDFRRTIQKVLCLSPPCEGRGAEVKTDRAGQVSDSLGEFSKGMLAELDRTQREAGGSRALRAAAGTEPQARAARGPAQARSSPGWSQRRARASRRWTAGWRSGSGWWSTPGTMYFRKYLASN
jgi:hypothetical protein